MAEIISVSKAANLKKGLGMQKKIVLIGGCFDVLHPGHIVFLEKAKKQGDILVVLLESDKKVRDLKGKDRPYHSQKDRAKVLSAIRFVDYVVILPFLKEDTLYDKVLQEIKPDIIAVSSGYANIKHQERAAKNLGIKLKSVTKLIGNHSTSRILKH